MTAKPKPHKQGDDTGLCALISVVNAVRWLFPEVRALEDDGETEHLSVLLKRHLIADAMMTGDQFRSLYLYGDYQGNLPLPLAERAARWLKRRSLHLAVEKVKVRDGGLPLSVITPKQAVIIGLGKPWEHYTVGTRIQPGGVITLFDSDVFEELKPADKWPVESATLLERTA